MKALFVCKKRIDGYGKSYGLINSAMFVSEYLNSVGCDSSVVTVVDANSIDSVVTSFDPDYVFIEAIFVTPAKFVELLSINRHKRRIQAVRIHSKLAFLANEGIAFNWLNGYKQIADTYNNFFVTPNTSELAYELKNTIGLNTVWLPNIYIERTYNSKSEVHNQDLGAINIGCFGAIRPMKNHLTQAVAAILFAKKLNKRLRFHVNADRCEQNGDQVFKNLNALFDGMDWRYELVCHPWLNHEDFISLVSTMDFGMQVSMSETFNIVAADFVTSGKPLLVSNDISWVNKLFRICSSASAQEMADQMDYLQRWRIWNMQYLNVIELYLYNRKATKEWLKFIY